jgi:short-subunit dehydrogenase
VRTAIVTGASSGIGEATARRLGRDGWRLVLVARREDRLEALASELPDASFVAADLTDADAPHRIAAAVDEKLEGRLELLVNNAGTSKRARFGDADGGYATVRRIMEVNFDAVVRLTEELLPALRRSAPSSIVNVASVAGRVAYPRGGAYSASKFALAGWTEALQQEEAPHGVHVGLVLPGFIATEGFPQDDLTGSAATRWLVSKPERVADAIVRAGPGGKHEVVVPRGYRVVPVLRAVAPGLVRRVTSQLGRGEVGETAPPTRQAGSGS